MKNPKSKKSICSNNAKETKITFRGTEYSFICVSGEYMVRRIDMQIPRSEELFKVLNYIAEEFKID
jgi:uncharacterized protein YacL (UPF0231 family)